MKNKTELKIKVGDLVNIPILSSVNTHGNFILAETFIPKSSNANVVCEIAAITGKPIGILLLVPKSAGWNFESQEFDYGDLETNFKTNGSLKYKTLQHNGWWLTKDAIGEILNGSW